MEESLVRKINIDALDVQVYDTPVVMGKAAAELVAQKLQTVLNKSGHANLLLATGASQFEFLKALKNISELDWSKITTFHLDEYVGLSPDHPASFRKYLHDRIIDKVQPGKAYFLNGNADSIQIEINRYEKLLKSHPVDVACIGIGENGHLAFNDPPVADFEDPDLVKVVELDKKSRQQQVDEGWFDSIGEVPRQALTLTIPAIMQSDVISCVVPDRRKAEAVFNTLNDSVSTDCPATILRTHPGAMLFLDKQSASKLDEASNKNKLKKKI